MDDAVQLLIEKRHIFPEMYMPSLSAKGPTRATLIRQLDLVLLANGFKLSQHLITYIGSLSFGDALTASNDLLQAVKKIKGGHVQHNPYFIEFPKNVPVTADFWWALLSKYYETTGQLTNNLLDFPEYGTPQHSYEEMAALHSRLVLKNPKLQVIELGKGLSDELQDLYRSLATSNVPLNKESLDLLGKLFNEVGFAMDMFVPMRENRAVINAFLLEKGLPIRVDTVTDILRLAVALSKGDVTLATDTKFKSFPRAQRRRLLAALDALLVADRHKMDDAWGYREQFKRLCGYLHPFEYGKRFAAASAFFQNLIIDGSASTYGMQLHAALENGATTGDYAAAIQLLVQRPGYFMRNVDVILRQGNPDSVTMLVKHFRDVIKPVSSRVLLSLAQHLTNRVTKNEQRIFVNRLGRAYSDTDPRPPLSSVIVEKLQRIISQTLQSRIPKSSQPLVIDWDSLAGIALPISEKSKSEGHAVLPRGSTMDLGVFDANTSLRFFTYWKQDGQRTDFDLSASLYDKDFNFLRAIGWTDYGEGSFVTYSGDITTAPNGATEFIDVQLVKVAANVAYIVPTINRFAGNNFSETKESFFGYMIRPWKSGLPFEAKTVETKFSVRGNGQVAIPMVFMRNADNPNAWSGKWVDLYSKGRELGGNTAEGHRTTTIMLVRAIVENQYLPLESLVKLHADRAAKVISATSVRVPKKQPVTYIGRSRMEGLHPDSKVITLDQFSELVP